MIATKKKEFLIEYRPTSFKAVRLSSSDSLLVEEVIELTNVSEGSVAERIREFASVKANGYLSGACAVYPRERMIRKVNVDTPKGKESEFLLDFIKSESKRSADEMMAFCLDNATGSELEVQSINKRSVLVCGAPRQDFVDLQDDLLSKGIYPSRLELGSVSMIGLFKDVVVWSDGNHPMLLLEIEDEFTNAVIIGGQGVEMARRIEVGLSDVAEALKEEMMLKDLEAATKLLSSSDFDLGSIAPKIFRKLLRELQSSIGFYEVQTGQSVSRVYCSGHGEKMVWFQKSLSELLNLEHFKFDVSKWLGSKGIGFANETIGKQIDASWLGLLSLACDFGSKEEGGAK